jgi:hypothetical protein
MLAGPRIFGLFAAAGAVSLSGRSSVAYFDSAFAMPITQRLFFEAFVGGAIHNGSLTPTPTLSGLRCPLLFYAGHCAQISS